MFAHFLYTRDIENFNPRKIPKENKLIDQQARSEDSIESFYRAFLDDNWEIENSFNEEKQDEFISRKDLHDSYMSFCELNKMRLFNVNIFWKKTKEIFPEVFTKGKKVQGTRYAFLGDKKTMIKHFNFFTT